MTKLIKGEEGQMFSKRNLLDRRETLKLLTIFAASVIFPRRAVANLVAKTTGNGNKGQAQLVAVGSGAGNIIPSLMRSCTVGFRIVHLDTDLETLKVSKADTKIWMGGKIYNGFPLCTYVEIAKRAARAAEGRILDVLRPAQLNLITTFLGGGAGSGAGPLVADWSRASGTKTLALVTMPFTFEGADRFKRAVGALSEFKTVCEGLEVHQMSTRHENTFKQAIIRNDELVAKRCLELLETWRSS